MAVKALVSAAVISIVALASPSLAQVSPASSDSQTAPESHQTADSHRATVATFVRTIAPRVEAPKKYSVAGEEDLTILAAELGINQAEARRLYGWEDDAALATTTLSEAHAGDFSYARVDSSGSAGPRLTVAFKAAPPEGLESLFVNLPVPVLVYQNARYTEIEFQEETARIHYSLIHQYGTSKVSTGGDIERGTIGAVVDSRSATSGLDPEAPESSLPGVTVTVKVEPHDTGQGDATSD